MTRFIYFPRSHLIRPGLTRFNYLSSIPSSRLFSSQFTTMDSVTTSLAALSLKPSTVSHTATNSPAARHEAVAATSDVPKDFELIKTLVYKPKTAKTATPWPVPVIVIAREAATVHSGAIGKKLNLKDMRLASEDLVKEFFALDKDSHTIAFFRVYVPTK